MTAAVPATIDHEPLRSRCREAGQEHILEDWDKLSPQEQERLAADVQALDFPFIRSALAASLAAAAHVASGAEPVRDVVALDQAGPQQRAEWERQGLHVLAQGKAAILLLAGGQGTRLGSSQPKGCYDMGLPSRKSLFQLQAERLLRLQELAAAASGGAGACKPLRWFIMTSPFTHAETLAHFEAAAYFGLLPSQVTFFQQGWLPCLTEAGRVIMQSSSEVAKAPDGNGGLYRALATSGALAAMAAEGVEALDCYCVDNALARLGDPAFLGCCYSQRTQVGARVVAKAYPEERVGVFASCEGELQVLEYSELDPAMAAASDPTTGVLLYNWSNICMHYFDVAWLQELTQQLAGGAAYHIARKQIPSKEGNKVPGLKLEMFIFDPFGRAQRTTLFEVGRADHFAPVKNAPGAAADTPEAARAALMAQGARWVAAAGGRPGAGGCEVSPLASYAGEGLEGLVEGREVGDLQQAARELA